jgi:hypothetical protein
MRLLGFFVVLAALGTLIVWQSGWNPFLPKDYEECRRNARGGYTYYDSRQNVAFAIAGPNPTTEEWAYIEKQYAKYFDDLAKAEEAQRRQDAELHRMQREAQQQAEIAQADQDRKLQLARLDLERRRQAAVPRIAVTSTSIVCLYPALDGCGDFKMTTAIRYQSSESISALSVGWVFIAEGENCPTSVQTKRQGQVRLRPTDTVVLNIDGHDGPASKQFRCCVKITDAQITP